MLFLFPFVVGLTLKYYQEVPKLFQHLFQTLVHNPEYGQVSNFAGWLRRRYNDRVSPFFIFILVIALNLLYFYQILQDAGPLGWMVSGHLFQNYFGTPRGLSLVGLYAALLQLVLVYWVVTLIWKGVIFSWGLHELFNKTRFTMKVEPLHPDGCCGLKNIGNVAMIFNIIFFLIGIYISLKIIDKLYVQDLPLSADIGNPLMLGAYVIIAPLMFFFPLAAAHDKMKKAKEDFLFPLSRRCEEVFLRLPETQPGKDGLDSLHAFQEMERIRKTMMKDIPVWPFDFRSIGAFAGTVLVPLVPALLPFVAKLLFGA